MNRIYKFFSSPVLAVVLLLAFAVAMGAATFIENDFGTATAWVMVYEAWWFELIMLGLGMCFIANIKKYRLWRRSKWPILLFHIAFIFILLGAAITRHHSHGGVMRIREAASSNVLISNRNLLKVHISDGDKMKTIQKELYFSPLSNNEFNIATEFNSTPISISYNTYIPDAEPQIIDLTEGGEEILQMVIAKGNGRESIFLKKGEVEQIGDDLELGFDSEKPGIINITTVDTTLEIWSPEQLDFFIMASQNAGVIDSDTLMPMPLRTLYRVGDVSFVPLSYHQHGSIQLMTSAETSKDNDDFKDDALTLDIQIGDQNEKVSVLYRKGFLPTEHEFNINGHNVTLSYGAEKVTLPFALKLNDFQLERYPGSVSPSAYASEVTVMDSDVEMDYRIFMNNVLDYKGYRFFQASYDTDEKGTVLSVNYDRLGTFVTYLGYFLMGLGMFITLFGKGSRFTQINKELKSLKKQKVATLILLLICSNVMFANQDNIEVDFGFMIDQQRIAKTHTDQFGRLMVQDLDGRIKPINSLASEFIRKLSRSTHYTYKHNGKKKQLDPNQLFLSIHMSPDIWQQIPLIKVNQEKGGPILKNLPINDNGLVAFNNLIDENGNYILLESVEETNTRKPAEHSEADKELIKVDERFNILFQVLSGTYFKIFPNKNDTNDTWYSYTHHFNDFPLEDGQFVKAIMPEYFNNLNSNNLEAADENLSYIKTYQSVLGASIIPSENRVEAELFYNKINLNFWLFQLFFTTGFLLLVLAIVKIFTSKKWVSILWNSMIVLTIIGIVAFTGNIILRWYISGHAPWSNGYEMLVFVAWVLVLCGLMTAKKSDFALPLATLFSGALLFVSYLDWLNPEITNLMPVLKSVWLKVHVATIVSSYAPLALSAILGFMALMLMIFKTPSNASKINTKIRELTLINESSMTIGLFVLALGTFLGGVWANESWGRYWAWDPKETWALISIIVYAIVLHLRFIPGLKSNYTLNTASVFAFGSIIMTSFGVNYYLSGLHSYAAGDPLPIPVFVYVLVAVVFVVSVLALLKIRRLKKKLKS